MSWKIALLGSETYYEPNSDSEVLLATIGVEDPMASEDWFVWDVLGAPTSRPQIDDIQQRNGVAYHSGGQKKMIRLDFVDFNFPDEEHYKEQLEELLNMPFIYFYQGEYTFEDWSIHTANSCVMVAATKTIENIYEDGCTRITVNLQLVNPKVK